ncbi:MAG: peptidase M20 [Bacteroidetes bacterium OLB12]|nr:MAG: peptidase M20 [Bacteroidetes bacterium OLB12]
MPAFDQYTGFLPKKNTDLNKVAAEYARQSFREFSELLSLPNDAHFPQDIEKNVRWCEQAFAKRGFTTQRLITPTVPLLLAERKVKQAKKTVLIYIQIDGQPVDATQWQQESPWIPVIERKEASTNKWNIIPYERLYEGFDPDWRIFARSTSDAKGPAMAFLAALDAAHGLNVQPNYNLKVIMDFEEELGSPHLPSAVVKYKNELSADMLIIYDGPRHVSNQPTLSFGARGICEITLTTFGPRVPVHSGNYGNYTPNPAMRLAQLLASMKDDHGRVTIPTYYDGIILSDEEKAILKQVPDNETEIRKFLGIAKADNIGNNFQESLQYPTLNIRGLDALFVGKEARTLIPATATAEIDIRLVPGSDPDRLVGLVKKHIQDQGYYVIDREPTEDERMQHEKLFPSNRIFHMRHFKLLLPPNRAFWLTKAMVRAFGKEPIKIRMMGGSIPISPFVTTLNIPAVSVPTVNADNNQHAENENIRVGNYVDAVKTFLAILMEKL